MSGEAKSTLISLGNLSSNLYWDSYDDNTKIISNLNFVVLADGSNSSYVTPEFTIKVYIWDGSNPTFVATYTDPGIYHFGSRDYVDLDIDLSSLALPAGSYRLGVFVDADDDIPNSEDDPGDNAYLTDGDINFTPGGSTTSVHANIFSGLEIYPNPVNDELTVSWDDSEPLQKIELRDLNGKLVSKMTVSTGQSEARMDLLTVPAGFYLIQLYSENGLETRKIQKN